MFLLNFSILKKIIPITFLVFCIFTPFSLFANTSKPEDIMVLLDAADEELGDPLTYFNGLKDVYIVSGQKILYEKELLRSRFLGTLKKVMAGLHTALLPDYTIIVHGIIAGSLIFWPNGLEKVQLFRWFEQVNTKIKTDGTYNKKGKIKEILQKEAPESLEVSSKAKATQSSMVFDVAARLDEKKEAEQVASDQESKKRKRKAKCSAAKVKKARTTTSKNTKAKKEKTAAVDILVNNQPTEALTELPTEQLPIDQLPLAEPLLTVSSGDALESKQAPQEESAPVALQPAVVKKRVYKARKPKVEAAPAQG